MKKMMFTLAMIMGLGTTVAFADNAQTSNIAPCSAIAQTADEFTPIELKDLPQAVLDGITQNFPGSTAKSAAVATDEATHTTIYKITLTSANGNEQTALLSDKGEVINPNEPTEAEEATETCEETAFCDAI